VCGLFLALAAPAGASEDNVEQERTLSEILQDKRLQERRSEAISPARYDPEEEAARTERKNNSSLKAEGRRAGSRFCRKSASAREGANGGIKLTTATSSV